MRVRETCKTPNHSSLECFDKMYTSELFRAQETGRIILEKMGLNSIEVIKDLSLNERMVNATNKSYQLILF